jgi:hypothetical protein
MEACGLPAASRCTELERVHAQGAFDDRRIRPVQIPRHGSQAVVTSAGQLGIVASSAHFKRDIQGIGERSLGLLQLHPVTIRYKQNPLRTPQYGLVAEDVAKAYPELVTRGPGGAVESVQ